MHTRSRAHSSKHYCTSLAGNKKGVMGPAVVLYSYHIVLWFRAFWGRIKLVGAVLFRVLMAHFCAGKPVLYSHTLSWDASKRTLQGNKTKIQFEQFVGELWLYSTVKNNVILVDFLHLLSESISVPYMSFQSHDIVGSVKYIKFWDQHKNYQGGSFDGDEKLQTQSRNFHSIVFKSKYASSFCPEILVSHFLLENKSAKQYLWFLLEIG